MRALHTLTELQISLLDILWTLGEASASEIHAAQEETLELARNTVGTILTRLENDGVLTHRVSGREFIYRPTVSRDEVRRASLQSLADTLFSGSMAGMVSRALSDAEVAPGDVERIRRILDEHAERAREEPSEGGQDPREDDR